MSLVDDVLRELSARSGEDAVCDPVRGLRALPLRRSAGLRPGRFVPLPLAFAAGVGLATSLFWSSGWPHGRAPAPTQPAAVSSRPPLEGMRSSLSVSDSTPHEPSLESSSGTRLDAIRTQRNGSTTRVHFRLTRATEYRVRAEPDSRILEIVLPDTELAQILEPIELAGSAIEELEARPSESGLEIRLGLTQRARVQSQLVRSRRGFDLILDIEPQAAVQAPHLSARSLPTAASAAGKAGLSGPVAQAAPDPQATESQQVVQMTIVRHAERDGDERRRADRRAAEQHAAGIELLRNHRLPEAIERFEQGLATRPQDQDLRQSHVAALIAGERFEAARRSVEAGLALAPDSQRLRLLEARVLDALGLTGEAITRLRRDAPAVKDAPEYHAVLAGLERKRGQSEQAAQRYRSAVRAAPRNAAWWLGLGLSLEDVGRTDRALSAYRVARSLGRLDPRTLHWMDGRIRTLGGASTRRITIE